ncbi:membrane protein [Pilimelia anulata]|uniref:Membrane protein n=1 Tax=Pilimelia anulata TaxID=53371 RepID=A0A8J3BGL9_9ACTN|nr:thioredoxin domain-containing protein [Pilimelia anulata]GGK06353.1 membrane protein [Pilimelia anulata]
MSKRPANKAMAATLAAERRRQRTFWASLIAVAVLLVAGIIGYGIYASHESGEVRIPKGTAAGDDTGLAQGTGKAKVDLYLDYLCPVCKQFEDSVGPTLDGLVQQNKATLIVHPVAFLDRLSNGTEFSTRASAAAACAADGGKFPEFNRALFARQPGENTPGLPNETIIEIGKGVGLGDDFASCVDERTYRGWASHVTDGASERGVTGTPTVLVNGTKVDNDPAKITAAVTAAQ